MISKLEQQYMNLRDAAAYIGLSFSTLRRLVDSGKLTPHRPTPGRVLISRDALDNLVRTSANGRGKRRKQENIA